MQSEASTWRDNAVEMSSSLIQSSVASNARISTDNLQQHTFTLTIYNHIQPPMTLHNMLTSNELVFTFASFYVNITF